MRLHAVALTWRRHGAQVRDDLPVHARQWNVYRRLCRRRKELPLLLPHLILQRGVTAELAWLLRD